MSSFQRREFFHEGMREFQDEFDGRRVADAIERHRKHYYFWDDERELIQSTQFFFIASTFGEYVDCSVKSGDPGFVKIVGENVVEYPEYDGNSMYRTIGNIKRNPNVGLLFVRFDGKSRRVRVNGKASIHTEAEFLERHYGAKVVVRIECELSPYLPETSRTLPKRPLPHMFPERKKRRPRLISYYARMIHVYASLGCVAKCGRCANAQRRRSGRPARNRRQPLAAAQEPFLSITLLGSAGGYLRCRQGQPYPGDEPPFLCQ